MNPRKLAPGFVLLSLSTALMAAAFVVRYLEPFQPDWLIFLAPSFIGTALGGYLVHDGFQEGQRGEV